MAEFEIKSRKKDITLIQYPSVSGSELRTYTDYTEETDIKV